VDAEKSEPPRACLRGARELSTSVQVSNYSPRTRYLILCIPLIRFSTCCWTAGLKMFRCRQTSTTLRILFCISEGEPL
jgi:hypothetical protein